MATKDRKVTKKKSTAKTHKTPTRKASSAKRSSVKNAKSFKIVSSETPFMTLSFTKQTIYWLIFMLSVLALGLWIINLQDKINRIYDQVDANSAQLEYLPEEYKEMKDASNKAKDSKKDVPKSEA